MPLIHILQLTSNYTLVESAAYEQAACRWRNSGCDTAANVVEPIQIEGTYRYTVHTY